MTLLERSVIPHVVERGNCIGCGMCVALCPGGALDVAFNARGFLVAEPTSEPCSGCGRCLAVCPFAPDATDEDEISASVFGGLPGIRHDPVAGAWAGAFTGAVRDSRDRSASASGGLVTAVLKALLRQGHVERVALVVPTGDPSALFEYRLVRCEEDVARGAGSAYYPVTMQDVLRDLISDPAPTAIVALPCFAKALRLGAMKSPGLHESVRVAIGLACGQTLGECAVGYLASRAGVPAEGLRSVTFRHKGAGDRSAQDFGVVVEGTGPAVRLSWHAAMARPFAAGAFVPQACQFCDDVFAECADAVFMDAWLPEAVKDRRGTSLVVARGGVVADLLDEPATRLGAGLKPIPIESVVLSQSGAVERKRASLAFRLAQASSLGLSPPQKRRHDVSPSSWAERYVWRRTWEFSRASVEIWRAAGTHREFDRQMRRRLRIQTAVSTALRFARAARRRIRRSLP